MLVWAAALLAVPLVQAAILPFDLSDVKLSEHTFQHQAAVSNQRYLLDLLDADRLLWVFRKNAKLPIGNAVPFYGTWEDPGCELRGHFVGHYLSALSFVVMSTGNETAKARLQYMITELGKVQDALGGGYLSAFPSEHFDRVEAIQGVWAPYYVIHKIMAGLLDAHQLAGIPEARSMVEGMAGYFHKRIQACIRDKGREHWDKSLEIEFGGMNDIMYRLYRLTKSKEHLEMASWFDKPRWYNAMVEDKDILPYHHANTHLAQVVGFAERYDSTHEESARAATANFFQMLTQHHSYATGGSNDKEFWQMPDMLADAIVKQKDAYETQEICTQYNVLKIARSLFTWTGDVRLADFYERALVNGILGVSRLTNDEVYHDGLPPSAHDHDHHHDHDDHDHNHLALLDDRLVHGVHPQHRHRRRGLAVQRAGGAGASMVTAHAAAVEAATGGSFVAAREREFNPDFQDYWGFNIAKMPNGANATNEPGTPGAFLYLLPLGTGQSKRDNNHHWGYPLHSFWCCYGTAIESFAKLADSIYFHSPGQGTHLPEAGKGNRTIDELLPRLYINQYVSSTLTWKEVGMSVTATATMYGPGPSVQANYTFAATTTTTTTDTTGAGGAASGGSDGGEAAFTVLVRLPQWAALKGSGRALVPGVITVNGQPWGFLRYAKPGSYWPVTRRWKAGDVLAVRINMGYWVKPLPETRPQFKDLKALMMGPYVMAGLTHDSRWLTVPSQDPKLMQRWFSEPPPTEGLVSIQASWNTSLYLRHDTYHAYLSAVSDGGDALDGTFRLVRGCAPAVHPSVRAALAAAIRPEEEVTANEAVKRADAPFTGAAGGGAGTTGGSGGVGAPAAGGGEGEVVMLEAMGMPGFYLGWQSEDGLLVVQQPSAPRANAQPGAHPGDVGGADGAAAEAAGSWQEEFCAHHSFRLLPGADGRKDTVSLEAATVKGLLVSGANLAEAPACKDYRPACSDAARKGLCVSEPELYVPQCRLACGACRLRTSALSMQQQQTGGASGAPAAGDAAGGAGVSFRLVDPAAHRYPPGAKIVHGVNRRYLVAPLGNLVDERYTVYFNLRSPLQQQRHHHQQ